MPRYAVVEAPSVLGLKESGVETLPDALLAAGLAERIGARRAGRVAPPPYDPARDAATGLLNPGGIAAYTLALADAVGDVLDRGEFPVVLGGDCSVVLGNLLALRRRERDGTCHGLLFLDGHADAWPAHDEPNGEAASMDLWLATGHGPDLVAAPEGRRPLVRPLDVAVVGRRDVDGDGDSDGPAPPPPAGALDLDLAAVRALGAGAAAGAALSRLTRPGLAGFWVHVDADVLDDAVMPAVDYRMPGGLAWDELAAMLRAALATGRARGLEVTICNPRLDPGGGAVRGLAACLAGALAVA